MTQKIDYDALRKAYEESLATNRVDFKLGWLAHAALSGGKAPTQADYCRYGVCKPGERHVPGCTEYTATEIAASQDSVKGPK